MIFCAVVISGCSEVSSRNAGAVAEAARDTKGPLASLATPGVAEVLGWDGRFDLPSKRSVRMLVDDA